MGVQPLSNRLLWLNVQLPICLRTSGGESHEVEAYSLNAVQSWQPASLESRRKQTLRSRT
jgi:hypothetical protein